MGTLMDYSRAIRVTASGVALNRPTRVSNVTVRPGGGDTVVFLRDGGAAGPILWDVEADNASGSHGETFNPPIKFDRNVYVDFTEQGANSSCCISVIEA